MSSRQPSLLSITKEDGTNVLLPSNNGQVQAVRNDAAFGSGTYYAYFDDGTREVIGGPAVIGGMIGGGGTLNFIPKFTPNGTTLGDSSLFDNGNIGYGTVAPVGVAAFDIVSTTKGVLFPRMTTAQRNLIVVGATTDGLLIFNTSTEKFNFWNQTLGAWESIDTATGGDVSGLGVTNFITKWTDGPNSVLGDSIVFDDGTNVGISIAVPLSKLHVAGAIRTGVASATNGSLVFQNSTNANTVTINSGVTSASYSITLPLAQGAAGTFLQNDGAGNLSFTSMSTVAWLLDGNTVGVERWIGTIDNFDFPIRSNNTEVARAAGSGNFGIGGTGAPICLLDVTGSKSANYITILRNTHATGSGLTTRIVSSAQTEVGFDVTTGLGVVFSVFGDGMIGAGTTVPTAKVHIVGLGNTSATYALKVENLALADLFFVKNDGGISMPSLQTGNAGLVSGELYVDTAANILANADLVVGRKV